MYGFPESLTQPGMGAIEETLSEKHTRLLKQLHALAISIGQARDRGDVKGVMNLRAVFVDVARQYRALGDTDLTDFDRFLLGIDEWINASLKAGGKIVKDTIGFAGDVTRDTLLKLAIPIALVLGAVLFAQGTFKKIRRGEFD